MATFLCRVRPLDEVSRVLFTPKRNWHPITQLTRRTLSRCYSQILSHSRCKQDMCHSQLRRCLTHIHRYNSTVTSSAATNLNVNYIPPPPKADVTAPELMDITETLNALGEPTLQSLGLGSYYPTGIIQTVLEALHVHFNIPWAGAIMALTVGIRVCMFPVFVKQQKVNRKFMNFLPVITLYNEKIREASLRSDTMARNRYYRELNAFQKKQGIGHMQRMWTILLQTPIFISYFWGVRAMTELPVQSMTTGGLYWFKDLTVPDPYYILPLITAATLMANIRMGSEGLPAESNTQIVQVVLYAMPFFVFAFMQHFPAALVIYWSTSNAISLIQTLVFKNKRVSKMLGLPEKKVVKVKNKEEAKKKKKFMFKQIIPELKRKYKEYQASYVMQDRDRINEEIFKKAGTGSIQETFSYDPTKVKKTVNASKKKKTIGKGQL